MLNYVIYQLQGYKKNIFRENVILQTDTEHVDYQIEKPHKCEAFL